MRRRAAAFAVLFAALVVADASAATERGFLGLEFARITPAAAARTPLRKARGALIVNVVPGGPADRAGIKIGEVLTAIDATQIGFADEAARIVRSHRPGDRVTLTLYDVVSGEIHPHRLSLAFVAELPPQKILTVKPPRTLAREYGYPPSMAANAAWSLRIARGATNPLALTLLKAGRCTGFAPEDWTVSGGGRVLHLVSPDGASHAIYKIMPLKPGADPRGAALALLAAIFRARPEPSESEPLPFDFRIFHFGVPSGTTGFVIYRASDNALSLWIAGVPASDAADLQPVAGAVALSIRCVSDLAPRPVPNPPTLAPVEISVRCQNHACGEGDLAGAYLDTIHLGYAHGADGDVYLVQPRHDLWQTGPDGPGFYRQVGGAVEKLEPGRTN